MIRFLLRNLFFLLTGWKIDNRTYLKTEEIFKERVVCVFSHTSSFDVVPFVFTKFSYPVNSIAVTIKEQYYGNIFKRIFFYLFNIFPIDTKGNLGMTDVIVDKINEVSDGDRFSFAISPEGTREKTDKFKTGFYYIAKKTNSYILVCLPCFETNTFIFQDFFQPRDLEDTLVRVEKGFYEGIPLHPQKVHYEIKKHQRNNLTIIDWGRISHLLGIFLHPQYFYLYLLKLYFGSNLCFIDFIIPALFYKNYWVSFLFLLEYLLSYTIKPDTKWKTFFYNVGFLSFNYILLNFELNF